MKFITACKVWLIQWIIILPVLSFRVVYSQNWAPLVTGDFKGAIITLYAGTTEGILYAGGDFDSFGKFNQQGDTTLNTIAKWDGTKWHALGNGMGYQSGYVNVITQ